MPSRPSTAAPILAVLAVVLVTLGAYAGGYFWFGERNDKHAGLAVQTSLDACFLLAGGTGRSQS